MLIIALVRKDLQRLVSDRRALVINLALPLVLTLIMGASFGGTSGNSGISAIPVALVAPGLPEGLRSRLAEGLQETGFFAVTWADSAAADAAVRRGDIAAALVIPEHLLQKVSADTGVVIEVWKDPGSPLKSGIVEVIVERMLGYFQAGEAASRSLWPDDFVGRDGTPGVGLGVIEMLQGDYSQIWRRLRTADGANELKEDSAKVLQIFDHQVALSGAMSSPALALTVRDLGTVSPDSSGEDVNLFNYFLPGFAVFFLMFAVAASARDIHRERGQLTLRRQLVSPVTGLQFVAAKWLTAVVQGVLQLAVLFGMGAVFFRVNLGPDVASLLLVIGATCAAAAGLFILLALLAPTEKIMDNLSTIVVLLSAMIGGNFIPIDAMPPWIQQWGHGVFNYWANLGFTEVVVKNHTWRETPQPVMVLGCFAVVFLLADWLAFVIRDRRGGMV